MKTIKEFEMFDCQKIGIISALEWFEMVKGKQLNLHRIYKDYFVVGTWADYHDGEKSNIEGKTTIAICHDYKHAEIIMAIETATEMFKRQTEK